MHIYVCVYTHKHICRERQRSKDGHYELCLAWNSQRLACLCLPSSGIKGMCHLIWLDLFLLFLVICVWRDMYM